MDESELQSPDETGSDPMDDDLEAAVLDDEIEADDGLADEPDDGHGEASDADDEVFDDDEDAHATVVSAPTVEAARRLALEGLRKIVPSVSEADVEFIVLEEGSKGGFFGRGKIEAQVEARLRPSSSPTLAVDEGPLPGAEALREFVQGVIDRMGVEATIEAYEAADAVHAEISGDDLGILIGRHGTTIDALQYIAAIVVNGARRHRRQVVVDAEGYRKRREVSLKALADRMAQKSMRESSSVRLKPMTAAERKVIHLHLKDHPRVETVSEGNEPYRAVVISPRARRP